MRREARWVRTTLRTRTSKITTVTRGRRNLHIHILGGPTRRPHAVGRPSSSARTWSGEALLEVPLELPAAALPAPPPLLPRALQTHGLGGLDIPCGKGIEEGGALVGVGSHMTRCLSRWPCLSRCLPRDVRRGGTCPSESSMRYTICGGVRRCLKRCSSICRSVWARSREARRWSFMRRWRR